MEINLQFFGGRGASSGSDGKSLGHSKGENVSIKSEMDVWSYRHNPNNEPFVDSINGATRDISNDFPSLMKESVERVNAAELSGTDKTHTLGYYGGGSVSINANYTDIDKMNNVYDNAVKSGYHPSRGNKTGTEAVTYHELGHAITDHIKDKVGAKNLDKASEKIVNSAYKATKGRGGTEAWAKQISGYAAHDFAECVAEAVSDFYCNGSKAHKNSKAIMAELKKYS